MTTAQAYANVTVMRNVGRGTGIGFWAGASLPLALTLAGCAGEDDARGDGSLDGAGTMQVPADTGADDEADDEDTAADDEGTACVPGSQNDCNCAGGLQGFQVCDADGAAFGDCMCEAADDEDTSDDMSDESDGTTGSPDPCGNRVCEEDLDEDCASCEIDCGACQPCTLAQSCDGAQIPPVIETHAAFLDDPMAYIPPPQILDELAKQVEEGGIGARIIAAALSEPAVDEAPYVGLLRAIFDAHPVGTDAVRRQLARVGMSQPDDYVLSHQAPTQADVIAFAQAQQAAMGANASFGAQTGPAAGGGSDDPCANPSVRIRVARLTVHEEDDDVANDEVYCAITSEGPEHSELKITPLTTALDEGDSIDYALADGLIWGQGDLTAPGGNILINYNCIESDTANGYSDLLMAVGDAVGMVDGKKVGVDGWVFPAAGVVTNLLAGALTLDGDDLLFNGSQVVAESDLLALTWGAWWSVRRDGTNIFSDWDWELRMEIWGCHEYGTATEPPPPPP